MCYLPASDLKFNGTNQSFQTLFFPLFPSCICKYKNRDLVLLKCIMISTLRQAQLAMGVLVPFSPFMLLMSNPLNPHKIFM